ncbi:MAG: HlyD family efflux transporter periplasmic adaptor subunit [Clostridia bacterium]|nr:HlyD family efflux transporter periplasmic adaptor subunit [Clostridia bacterium]
MNNKLGTTRRILAVFIAVLIIVYLVHYAVTASNDKYITETATFATLSDTIQTDAWIIRNESVVDFTGTGVLSYEVSDGGRVSKGSSIAGVYECESDATATARAQRIQDEIDILTSLSTSEDSYSGSADAISTQIGDNLCYLMSDSGNGRYSAADSKRAQVQYLLSEKQIILGKESAENYSERIEQLEQERDAILENASKSTGSLKADNAGYFISDTDGYENSFDLENIHSLTVEDIEAFDEIKPDSASHSGKIATDFVWYVVCVIDEADRIKIENSWDISIEFQSLGSERIPATLGAINTDSKTGKAVVVLECNYMNSYLASLRNESISIVVGNYSGVLVNEKAIHFADVVEKYTDENGNEQEIIHKNVKGVYVKSGEKLKFVQVYTIRTVNGYAVCKTTLSYDEQDHLYTSNTIRLYDEVVTGGKNLYDGKIIS